MSEVYVAKNTFFSPACTEGKEICTDNEGAQTMVQPAMRENKALFHPHACLHAQPSYNSECASVSKRQHLAAVVPNPIYLLPPWLAAAYTHAHCCGPADPCNISMPHGSLQMPESALVLAHMQEGRLPAGCFGCLGSSTAGGAAVAALSSANQPNTTVPKRGTTQAWHCPSAGAHPAPN